MDKKQIQRNILNASFDAGACHLGSALSCVDILIDLYDNVLKDDDIFLFSKASGVATLYAILSEKGYFTYAKLVEYLKAHPLPSKEVPGVLHSFGSLGHGLSVATGLALADRKRKVYVLLSDGEMMEGSTYEACLFIGQHNLTNLYVHVDDNKIAACGRTEDILNLDNAFEFFGKNIPNFIRHETIKGDGGNTACKMFENKVEWHYRNLDKKTLDEALKLLDKEEMPTLSTH